MLVIKGAGDFKKLILIYHSKNLRARKYFAKSTLPVLYQRNNKAWMSVHLFTTWFTKYFKPIIKVYSSEKKKYSVYLKGAKKADRLPLVAQW